MMTPMAAAATATTTDRREAILRAAAELFASEGYTATSMNDIGAAVGITGGALYRHFESKRALLQVLVVRTVERTVARVAEIVETAPTPEEKLDRLLANLVEAMVANPMIVRVWSRERHHLDASTMEFVDRSHRLHVAEWVSALTRTRPELSELEKWTLVQLVWGSTTGGIDFDSGLEDARLTELLVDAGRRMLAPSSFMVDSAPSPPPTVDSAPPSRASAHGSPPSPPTTVDSAPSPSR
jgi:AcrR family transcriptional regulator